MIYIFFTRVTIKWGLIRNTGSRGYRPKQACHLLHTQWGSEQIAFELPKYHEALYQHVYADKAQGGNDYLHETEYWNN
jgi:hypothetical protein